MLRYAYYQLKKAVRIPDYSWTVNLLSFGYSMLPSLRQISEISPALKPLRLIEWRRAKTNCSSTITNNLDAQANSEPNVDYSSMQIVAREEKTPPGCFVHLKNGKTYFLFKEAECAATEDSEEHENKPIIVFLHGASVFSFVWNRLAELLHSHGYPVLMFDFYGHGYSEVPPVNYTCNLFREQLEELLESLELLPTDSIDRVTDPPSTCTKETEEGTDSDQVIEINISDDERDDRDTNEEILHAIEDIPNDVYESVDPSAKKKKYRKFILIGHSMGGLIASEFAAKYKDLVSKIILFNAAGLPVNISYNTPLPLVLTPIIKVLRTTRYFDNIAHILGRGLKLFGDLVYKVSYEDICCGAIQLNEEGHDQQLATPPLLSTLQQFADEKTWRLVQGLLFLANTWLVQLRVNAARSTVLLSVVRDLPLLDANHSETFAKIREKQIPVLIFWGEHDTILPSHLLESYQKCLPHAKLLCLPGDHGVFLSRPYQVFESMKNFIQNSEVY